MNELVKRVVLAGLVLFAMSGTVACGADGVTIKGGFYGRQILIESNADKTVRDAAAELADYLKQITGLPFAVTNAAPDPGMGAICLLNVSSPLVPETDRARLKDKGLEAFVLHGDAFKLQIVANDWRGLRHGTYFYLEQLGVRWLMAGANWTVVPKRTDVTLILDRLVAPAFFARSYGGTGGFYSNHFGRRYTGSEKSRASGIAEFEVDVMAWERHLRWGGQALGHAMGEGFVSDRTITPILEAHPEYLAKIDGEYSPLFTSSTNGEYILDASTQHYRRAVPPEKGTHALNITAKLNAGNPDAVSLFSDWILKRLRAARKGPQGYAIQTVSVEPSDGAGEGNNYDELKAQGVGDGSESDQEFYIANYIARKVRAEFPDVSVVMLAYAQRTDPPTFALEPNFIVQPAFAFRFGKKTAGLSNDEWLDLWAQKAKTMAVYDYWSIPDWTHDEPTFNYLDLAKKLRGFYGRNIKGINAESTYSGGAMGIGQYLAAHLMWEINLDEQALLADWYDNAFGPAKAPMKRMLERWARGYRPISVELGASYHDISEAEQLAAAVPPVLARVDDFARYLHYLRLYDEFKSATNDVVKKQIGTALAEHIFNINESRMVHTTRIFDLLAGREGCGWFRDEFQRAGRAKEADGPGWARVHMLSHDEVARLIAEGQRAYPPADFDIRSFTGKLVPLHPTAWHAPAGDPWGPVMPAAIVEADVLMPEGLSALPLRVSRNADNKVTVTDVAGRTVCTHAITKSDVKDAWDEMHLPLAPGHYHLAFATGRLSRFHFQTWKGVSLVLRRVQTQKGGASCRLYFYVPHDQRKIAIYFPDSYFAGGFETPFYDPDGKRAKSQGHDGNKLLVIDVPPGMDGKVWSLDRLVQPYFNFEMLTVPQAFSLEPQTLLVPGDAL